MEDRKALLLLLLFCTIAVIRHQLSWMAISGQSEQPNANENGPPPSLVQPSLATIDIRPTPAKGPRTPVALCTIQKEGEAYLDEWVNYNLALGFSKIFVYDNSEDHDLSRWAERRTVDNRIEVFHHDLPNQKSPQITAYENCLANLKENYTDFEFVAFLDLDEFLVMKKHDNVEDLVREHCPKGKCTSLVINWQIFGSNGEIAYTPIPLTKRFQYRLRKTDPRVKSIARIKTATNFHDVHLVNAKSLSWWDTKGPLRGQQNFEQYSYRNGRRPSDVAVVDHIFTRSRMEWKRRCSRGRAVKMEKNHPLNGRGCDPIPIYDDTVFDDHAWQFLKNRVPAYQWYDENSWIFGWNSETSKA